MTCEDAPCCGCCGYEPAAEFDEGDFYDRDYSPADCDGDYDYCPFAGCTECGEEQDEDEGNEDLGYEEGLFGDC